MLLKHIIHILASRHLLTCTSASTISSCHCLKIIDYHFILLTCHLCWSDHRSQRCQRSSVWVGRCFLSGRMFAVADTRHSDNGSPLRSRTWCWRVCSLTLTCRYRSPLWVGGSRERERVKLLRPRGVNHPLLDRCFYRSNTIVHFFYVRKNKRTSLLYCCSETCCLEENKSRLRKNHCREMFSSYSMAFSITC